MTVDSVHLLAGLGTGLCGGFLAGLFGVGGGIVMVPLLGLILNLDQHRAQGATLAAMLLPTGLPAVLQYRRRGIASSAPLVGVLILAFLFGIYGGATVANWIPSTLRCVGYAAFLVSISVRTFLRLRRLLGYWGDKAALEALAVRNPPVTELMEADQALTHWQEAAFRAEEEAWASDVRTGPWRRLGSKKRKRPYQPNCAQLARRAIALP